MASGSWHRKTRLCRWLQGGALGLLVLLRSVPGSASGPGIAEYTGLSAGTEKVFQVTVKEAGEEVERRQLHTRVLAATRMNDQDVVPVRITSKVVNPKSLITWTFIEYLRVSSDRVEMVAAKYQDDAEIHQKSDVRLKAPLDVGSTWRSGQYDKLVEGQNDKVEVPAGTFSPCLRIRTTRRIAGELVYEETAWHAPGLGQVKSVSAYPLEHSQILFQLLKVKQPPRKNP
jgi:hypothetical protein